MCLVSAQCHMTLTYMTDDPNKLTPFYLFLLIIPFVDSTPTSDLTNVTHNIVNRYTPVFISNDDANDDDDQSSRLFRMYVCEASIIYSFL